MNREKFQIKKPTMSIVDLRNLEHDITIDADLCIIGSGPAGLSIAKEFAGTNLQVWVLESGGFQEEAETQALYEIESVGVPRLPQTQARNRILGGSTHTWFGRSASFNEMDYKPRHWVPFSGWPINSDDLASYLERASHNLGLTPSNYDETLVSALGISHSDLQINSSLLRNQFWQYSKVSNQQREPVRFGKDFLSKVRDVPNIHILLHANVTHINTNSEGTKAESVDISTLEHKTGKVRAKAFVLCCGGVENARVLLASNRVLPQGVGNQNDMVGRFLADHPGTILGEFDTKDVAKVYRYFGNYWAFDERGKHYYNRGFALSQAIQEKEGLLNCAAYVNPEVDFYDPWEAAKRLKARIKKSVKVTNPVYEDILSIFGNPKTLADGTFQQIVKKRPPYSKVNKLELFCLTEQLPDPESRVLLSNQKDALGMPLSKLDWRISDLEKESVHRLSLLVKQEFERLNLPSLRLREWLSCDKSWRPMFKDRYHPSCSTRMSINPKEGVVDINCQVHDVSGLYVAGSSTFPTAGFANPTLMIIAMSIRIADRLKATVFNEVKPQYQPVAAKK